MKFSQYFFNRESAVAPDNADEFPILSSADSQVYAISLGTLKQFLGLNNQESVLARAEISASTSSIAPNSTQSITFPLGKAFLITALNCNVPARVRLYSSALYRDADLGRSIDTEPTGQHGLILEAVLAEGNLTLDLAPIVWGSTAEASEDIAASITNLSSTAQPVITTFYRLLLEA